MTTPPRPAAHLLAALEAERARGFAGLAGSSVDATIPLRQAAVDAAIAQVRGRPAALETLAVEIGDANHLIVSATVRILGFRAPVRLQLRLVPSMEDGIIRLVIVDGSLMASAVALLGPLIGTLPEGVRLEGRQISVDVGQLAAQQGFEDLAGMVSRAAFDSSPGVLWITVHAAAPVPGSMQPRRTSPSTHPTRPFDIAAVRTWLQGTQVDVDLHVDERLVNDLVTALHADAQVTTGDDLRDAVTRATRSPVVRLEAGVVRVTATAVLEQSHPPTG